MKKYNIKDDIMPGRELKLAYNSLFCPKGFQKFTNKGFVKIDNGKQGGTHWTCLYIN